MKERKSFGAQLEAFFEGKGFYIVLFLCAAVIGVSAWVLMTGTSVDEKIGDISQAEAAVQIPGQETKKPVSTPIPTTEPAVISTPEPEAEPESETISQVWNENSEPSVDLFVWPVSGEVITEYSIDALMFDKTMEDWRTHSGLDISAPLGTHVLASASGEVKDVISDALYGTTVTIRHANGLETVYSNLASQPTVYAGDKVSAGDVIGAVGDTAICESSLGAHLHFAVMDNGKSSDPFDFLP